MIDNRRVVAIARKDLLEVLRNKQALAPLIVVPLVFVVVFPVAIILLGGNPAVTASINGLQMFLDNVPSGALPADLSPEQALLYAILVFFMAPLFLVIPVMIASVVASSSFVGEKERRTLEGLLYTPATNRELVLGKVAASIVPCLAVTWAAFGVYAAIVGTLATPVVGRPFFPTATWFVVVFAVAPLIGFLAVTLIVAVSGRSTTVQGAQGVSILVVLPVIGLVVSQATGIMLFDVPIALISAAVLLAIDVVVFAVVAKTFRRERIITRL